MYQIIVVGRREVESLHHKHIHTYSKAGISIAFWLNLSFFLFALVGGLISKSSSLQAESVHTLGDTLSVAVAWLLERLSRRKADSRYTYGYRRYSLLAAIIISVLLIFVSLSMMLSTLDHLFHWGILEESLHSHTAPNATGMLIVAFVGLVVKSVAAYRLSKGHSLNERSVMFHMLMDSLSWGVILISSAVMLFIDIPWLDKILTLFIALWILYHMLPNLLRAFRILLQEAPRGVDVNRLFQKIKELDGIEDIVAFRLWSLDGEAHILTLTLVCSHEVWQREETQEKLKRRIRELAEKVGIVESTIEFTSSSSESENSSSLDSFVL